MKPISIVGVILIAVGVLVLVYQGITYTKRETIVDLGPIQATADRQKTVPLPPIVGIVTIVGGVALLIAGSRKS
jgi:uncharacterized membrane protein YidH (DUF202 family)